MRAFDKMVEIIKQSPQYGHFIENVKNKVSLLKAKDEIEIMLKQNKKGELL